MHTIELKIKLIPKNPWSDILIAELSNHGFDSFVDTDEGIMAYCEDSLDINDIISDLESKFKNNVSIELQKKLIPHENWNAQWESNFQPVYIEEYATIVAPFHKEAKTKGIVLSIEPKMSFGTGHHQTTWMMIKSLFEIGDIPNEVLDMGTGTGVLAILSEKLGANEVIAIDIDDTSIINLKENLIRNNCQKIQPVYGDIDKVLGSKFGLILANINKNILKSHMNVYADALIRKGKLLLSGFLSSDVDEIIEFVKPFNLDKVRVLSKDEWACIELIKV
ncbi:MAG: 50S ribosomal protein L11 methyltransferase [Crocinitomicaceae bacterium]|nr:50S ribosomal protein L11 methyltransferase [Crocinitomicaceae bacterium]|tara:strand:- start:6135 stop:6968 length:834 start_codon:yes stop_codon:yes gene_type:complete